MDYDLAAKLKEAGFREDIYLYPETKGVGNAPTLTELMIACEGKHGQRFRWLGNEKTHWSAQARPMHKKSKAYPDSPIEVMGKDVKAVGKTPEEAVANLWLSLNHESR